MQKSPDLPRRNWEPIQHCLSLLTGLPLFIYDPVKHEPCAPISSENPFCSLIHQTEGESLCQTAFAQQVDLAVQTEENSFVTCLASLHYFIIPIRISRETNYALIGGACYYSYEEFSEFKKEADRRGISIEGFSSTINETRFGAPEMLQEAARLLQTIGTALMENIYHRDQYQLKTAHLTTLLNAASQFKKELRPRELYDLLLNTLGILFDLRSASVFHRSQKQGPHKGIAAFGAKRELLSSSETLLDPLLQKRKEGEPYIFTDMTFDLLKARLPQETRSCALFPIHESQGAQTTLVILDTPLLPEAVKTIASFCQQARTVIEKIDLQTRLTKQQTIIHSLTNLTTLLGSPIYLEHLHENILEQALQLFHAEQGSLMVLDEGKKELSIKAMKGLNKTLLEALSIKPGEGISGLVYETGAPLLVQDFGSDPRIRQEARPRYKTGSFISVPLKLRDRAIGVISLADKITGEVFSQEDLQLLQAMGSYISIAIERSELYEKTEELKKISITDPLTGLLNRRYFQERLTEEVERSKRHKIPVSLVIMDIDNFKAVNDTYGHPAGDEILKCLSQALRNYIRTIDVAARYGGEEFTVILPQTNKEEARIIGCSSRWSITTTEDGTTVILRPNTKPWVRLSTHGTVIVWSSGVEMTQQARARIATKLARFWGRQRVKRQIDDDTLERICRAASEALRGRMDRAEMEWVASLGE